MATFSDEEGHLRVTANTVGNQCYIRILACTASGVLGFEQHPIPGSTSYVGELATAAPGRHENNAQGTILIAHDEDISSSIINRAILGSALRLEFLVRELDREVFTVAEQTITPKNTAGGILTTGSSYFFLDNPNVRIPLKVGGVLLPPNPTPDQLAKLSHIVDTSDGDVFYASSGVSRRNRIIGMHYFDGTTGPAWTPNTSATFGVWGVPDGKSIFGSSQIAKHAAINITSVRGNIIQCTGATFVSKLVQSGDTLVIQNATNVIPFSHNGEFIVTQVHNETTIGVRAKGTNEDLVFSSNNKPTSINTVKAAGTTYGQVMIPVGLFIPASKVCLVTESVITPVAPLKLRVISGKRLRDADLSDFNRALGGDSNEVLQALYNHILQVSNAHLASQIGLEGGTPAFQWANSLSPYAGNVQAFLSNMVSQLASETGTGGASLIGSIATTGGAPHNFSIGTIAAQLSQLLGFINLHVTGGADRHTASMVDAAQQPNWIDGTVNNAANLQVQIGNIVSALISQSGTGGGAGKIGVQQRPSWLNVSILNPATDVWNALKKIITNLGSQTANSDGASLIGVQATSLLPAGSLRAQIDNLSGNWLKLFSSTYQAASTAVTWAIQGTGQLSHIFFTDGFSSDDWYCIWRFKSRTNTSAYFRIMVGLKGFAFTKNAWWNQTGGFWQADVAPNTFLPFKYEFGDSLKVSIYDRYDGTQAWYEASWNTNFSLDAYGYLNKTPRAHASPTLPVPVNIWAGNIGKSNIAYSNSPFPIPLDYVPSSYSIPPPDGSNSYGITGAGVMVGYTSICGVGFYFYGNVDGSGNSSFAYHGIAWVW